MVAILEPIVICPNCKENRAHRSHRSGFSDYVMVWLKRRPYRCHNCQTRFYAYRDGEESPKLRTAEERRIMQLRRNIRWRRSKKELTLYLLATMAVAATIYYLIQQRIGG
jgi:hypothetical protein